MNIAEYRNQVSEQLRIQDIMRLMPKGESVLDIGARDGYFSVRLLERFKLVTALDVDLPSMKDDRIVCVKGDVTDLTFPSNTFDVVFCAEVLEHIPCKMLGKACAELARVAKSYVLIGVPFKQDIRVCRSTCSNCRKVNPPWGHVNSFDESRLKELFIGNLVETVSFVEENHSYTNFISSYLMDLAGNPYGTYSQEEPCIYCGSKLGNTPSMNLFHKICARTAVYLIQVQSHFLKPHANWIHILFRKVV